MSLLAVPCKSLFQKAIRMSSSTMSRSDNAPSSLIPPGAQDQSAARRRIVRAIPKLAIVGLLAGLAYWGHSTDWTLPKFSMLTGGAAASSEDWCIAHNVPESGCIECNLTLLPRDKDFGWCKDHGIAQCPLDHPEVAQLTKAFNPTPADFDRANRALALLPRAENNSRCKLHQTRIQFASADAFDKAGIDIAVALQRPVIEAVTANGELIYDQTNTAYLASRVAGTTWRVEKQAGDKVRKGEVLALIDAADVGRTKTDFLQAIAQLRLRQTNVDAMRPLVQQGGIAGKQFLEAETALEETQIRLLSAQQALVNLGLQLRAEDYFNMSPDKIAAKIQFLGLPAEVTRNLDKETTTSNLFPLRSPLDGIVVERKVVAGEVVDTSTTLFAVSDISRLWLMLDVRQEEAKYLSLGQPVLFRHGGDPDEAEIKGCISWISTSADAQTRTVKVRVELPNDKTQLRANTFGTGRIVLREEPKAIVIPSEAVHSDGCCQVVFVRDKDYLKPEATKFFHIRKVRTGVKENNTTEIIAGLLPGEVIASKNSVVLEAQLLKSNLGAGCGCADGH